MNKTIKRLFTFFIGIPLVFAIVSLKYCNHLLLQICLSLFAVVGANEFYNMLSNKKALFPKSVILILTAILPYISYLFILAGLSLEIAPWFFICESLILMAIESLFSKSFENSVSKIAYSMLIIFYCGFLMTFLSRLTTLENSTYIICLFLLFVFMCDSGAWFFGILFGKSTRGYIAASPNKSLVGFIGGLLASVVCGVIYAFIFNDILNFPISKVIILGFFTAFSSIVGDLIESVFKRSCNVKDSGNIIPGRGGVLDSIDSILIAAPVFYIVYYFLF